MNHLQSEDSLISSLVAEENTPILRCQDRSSCCPQCVRNSLRIIRLTALFNRVVDHLLSYNGEMSSMQKKFWHKSLRWLNRRIIELEKR